MITFFIVAASLALVTVLIKKLISNKPGQSIDLADTLLTKTDIHAEIAKTVEAIKSQEPVVTKKPKSKPAAKKTMKSKPKAKK